MITIILFNLFLALFNVLLLPLQWLSSIIGAALPTTMLSDFSTAIGYFFSFMQIFWPLIPVWQVFMLYISIKMFLLVARLIFGARVPDAS